MRQGEVSAMRVQHAGWELHQPRPVGPQQGAADRRPGIKACAARRDRRPSAADRRCGTCRPRAAAGWSCSRGPDLGLAAPPAGRSGRTTGRCRRPAAPTTGTSARLPGPNSAREVGVVQQRAARRPPASPLARRQARRRPRRIARAAARPRARAAAPAGSAAGGGSPARAGSASPGPRRAASAPAAPRSPGRDGASGRGGRARSAAARRARRAASRPPRRGAPFGASPAARRLRGAARPSQPPSGRPATPAAAPSIARCPQRGLAHRSYQPCSSRACRRASRRHRAGPRRGSARHRAGGSIFLLWRCSAVAARAARRPDRRAPCCGAQIGSSASPAVDPEQAAQRLRPAPRVGQEHDRRLQPLGAVHGHDAHLVPAPSSRSRLTSARPARASGGKPARGRVARS